MQARQRGPRSASTWNRLRASPPAQDKPRLRDPFRVPLLRSGLLDDRLRHRARRDAVVQHRPPSHPHRGRPGQPHQRRLPVPQGRKHDAAGGELEPRALSQVPGPGSDEWEEISWEEALNRLATAHEGLARSPLRRQRRQGHRQPQRGLRLDRRSDDLERGRLFHNQGIQSLGEWE